MKKILRKIKKPLCEGIVLICFFLLLGYTGTADLGGDVTTYAIRGAILLSIAIAAEIIGGLDG